MDVANYLYAQGVDVLAQGVPLLEELVLRPGEEAYVGVELAAVLFDDIALAHARVLVRPLNPTLHAEVPLQRHEQGVIRQPAAVRVDECGNLSGVARPAALAGETQHIEAVLVYFAVVDILGLGAPVDALNLVLVKQALFNKLVEVY